MKPKTWVLLLSLITALLSLNAQAHRKTDVVILYNGDRITGEIQRLAAGILDLKTDSMGRIKIEWQEISRVESNYNYEFRTSDGNRYFGSIVQSERPGQLMVSDLYGKHELEWLEVVELRSIEDSFAERLELYVSAGYSYTKASSIGQATLNYDLSYEDEDSRNRLWGRTSITDTDTETISSTRVDLTRQLWTDNTRVFRSIFANYENNDELDLEYRLGAGSGLGKYFLDTNRSQWLGIAGLQVITEKPVGGGSDGDNSTNQDVELFFNTSYSVWKFTAPELDFSVSFSVYPSVTDSGRIRSDGNVRLRWEVVEDLFIGISGWTSSDNHAQSSQEVDYGVTTELGWEY